LESPIIHPFLHTPRPIFRHRTLYFAEQSVEVNKLHLTICPASPKKSEDLHNSSNSEMSGRDSEGKEKERKSFSSKKPSKENSSGDDHKRTKGESSSRNKSGDGQKRSTGESSSAKEKEVRDKGSDREFAREHSKEGTRLKGEPGYWVTHCCKVSLNHRLSPPSLY